MHGGGIERPGEALVGVDGELHLDDEGSGDRLGFLDGDDGIRASLDRERLRQLRALNGHTLAVSDRPPEEGEEQIGAPLEQDERRLMQDGGHVAAGARRVPRLAWV